MYKVLTYFEDLQDNGHPYHPGDEFPRNGLRVSLDRIMELSGEKNRRGTKLIEVEVQAEPKEEVKAEPKVAPKATTKKRSRKTK